MATPIPLIYKILFPSIPTFETPPDSFRIVAIWRHVAGRGRAPATLPGSAASWYCTGRAGSLSNLLSRWHHLEQEAIAYPHAREELRRQCEHEPLSLLRLNLGLAVLRVERRHGRRHRPFCRITDFDVLGAQRGDGHRDHPATLIPHMVGGRTLRRHHRRGGAFLGGATRLTAEDDHADDDPDHHHHGTAKGGRHRCAPCRGEGDQRACAPPSKPSG